MYLARPSHGGERLQSYGLDTSARPIAGSAPAATNAAAEAKKSRLFIVLPLVPFVGAHGCLPSLSYRTVAPPGRKPLSSGARPRRPNARVLAVTPPSPGTGAASWTRRAQVAAQPP